MLMNHIWFSVFIAWSVKKAILRFGGASVYRASEAFFFRADHGRGAVQRALGW